MHQACNEIFVWSLLDPFTIFFATFLRRSRCISATYQPIGSFDSRVFARNVCWRVGLLPRMILESWCLCEKLKTSTNGITLTMTSSRAGVLCLLFNVWSLLFGDRVHELLNVLDFNIFFWWSEPSRWAPFLYTYSIFGAFASQSIYGLLRCVRGRSTWGYWCVCFIHIPVSAQSGVKRHSLMVQSACCFMNPSTDRTDNELDIVFFTTAFMNVSNFNYFPNHSDITSLATSPLNNPSANVSRNRADAVLISFEAALLPSCSMSTRVSSICVLTSAWVRSA